MENNIEQKPNKIVSYIKNENCESEMYYGTKEDGTMYWGININTFEDKKEKE